MAGREESRVARTRGGRFLVGICAALAAVLILGLLWALTWTTFAPLNLFEAPAVWPVLERVVRPGDVVFSDLRFCKRTDLPAQIGCSTAGNDLSGHEHIFVHPTISGDMPAGCYSKRFPVATIPRYARPGKYRVLIAIRYDYSPFRAVQQHFETEEFDVAPPPEGGVSSPHGQH